MRIHGIRWEAWNIDHIAGHGVIPEEVEDVDYSQRFTVRRVGQMRYLLTGQTVSGRYLSIVMDREQPSQYVVVTARDATSRERRDYRQQVIR